MASINITELRPVGSELFQDSESFLNELNDGQELDSVEGASVSIFISNSFGIVSLTISFPTGPGLVASIGLVL